MHIKLYKVFCSTRLMETFPYWLCSRKDQLWKAVWQRQGSETGIQRMDSISGCWGDNVGWLVTFFPCPLEFGFEPTKTLLLCSRRNVSKCHLGVSDFNEWQNFVGMTSSSRVEVSGTVLFKMHYSSFQFLETILLYSKLIFPSCFNH